jgi:hypothetical protein
MINTQTLKEFNLNLDALKRDCRRINNKVLKLYAKEIESDNFFYKKKYYEVLSQQIADAPLTSKLHDYYNVFHFPYAEIYKLYVEISKTFKQHNKYDQVYYIHAWLNYQHQGETIPPHYHWKGLFDLDETYYGNYCVNAEPSITHYKFPDGYIIDHSNKNNTFLLSKDFGDLHYTDPWPKEEPRITISMNIVPQKYLQTSPFYNTWIPIE